MSDLQQLAEPLLDANEAARLLHVPRSTLYELVRSRGLPHIRVGRHLRFTRSDLGAWVADHRYARSTRFDPTRS
ncbi:MAG TPA: helix-turn-helix domain-containing protein [Thermoanaerobaculia bacterium]|nr:helix-turn-helix domain-containing protein [Thermoanaerobaculia bacterium]